MDTPLLEPKSEGPPVLVQQALPEAVREWQWQRCSSGFSGAVLWRALDDQGNPRMVLKGWPVDVLSERLHQIHQWMELANHLPYVPRLYRWRTGGTVLDQIGRCWDLTSWQMGEVCRQPDLLEVSQACRAVAQLHAAWPQYGYGTCPAARHRWEWLERWQQLPLPVDMLRRQYPPWEDVLQAAERILREQVQPTLKRLQSWLGREGPLQVCLRDLRSEHVLFFRSGSLIQVSGIIDYGAMAIDHPAVDLARLLADYAAAQPERAAGIYAAGQQAYQDAGGNLQPWLHHLPLLAHAGHLAALVRWLVRLAAKNLPESVTLPLVFARLEELLRRLENPST
ncbi:MAG: aminoglycoside phosphotransferase family protein [Thermogemmata sp.]|nr:aminoglycoside phosphotransferase family protein [Thermogemmata sp.]